MGAPGVGKTRLVREFWEWLGSRSPEPLRRMGRCLPYGSGITYWPLGEVLKEHFGVLEDDRQEQIQVSPGRSARARTDARTRGQRPATCRCA